MSSECPQDPVRKVVVMIERVVRLSRLVMKVDERMLLHEDSLPRVKMSVTDVCKGSECSAAQI